MTSFKHVARLLAGIVPVLIATTASAKNYKIYPGQGCYPQYNQVFGLHPEEPLRYSEYLLITAEGPYSFMYQCPVIRDEWGMANGPDAQFRIYETSQIGYVCCGVSSRSLNGSSAYSKQSCTTAAFVGGWTNLNIFDLQATIDDGPYQGFCEVYQAKGARISTYWVGEEEQYD